MPAPPSPAITPARTRTRFAAASGVLVLATIVSVVAINALAERFPVRVDVTATREQELSPRTAKLLGGLAGNYEIVVAADWRLIDRRAAQRVRDVLDLFTRGSPRVTATIIDVTTASGSASYQRLLDRLARRDEPEVAAQAATIRSAADAAEQLASALESLGPRVRGVRELIPPDAPGADANTRFFDEQGARCGAIGVQLRAVASASRSALDAPLPSLGVPDLDAAAEPLRRDLASLEEGLRAVGDSLRRFADAEAMPPAAREAARPLAGEFRGLRDAAAIHADALARLGRVDAVRVARTLQAAEAALVIGPPGAGVTAIPLAWLFPPGEAIDAAGESLADMRRRNEELFATAIDSLARPVNPIVVLVHGWPHTLLDRTRAFSSLEERLGLRGIDMVEWPAALTRDPPSLVRLNPRGDRPVVYVSFSDDAAKGTTGGTTGAQRAESLGEALARLADDGKPILLSVLPSVMPTQGLADRAVAILPLFGLRADSGRPLLKDTLTPTGRVVIPDHLLLARESDHPIAGAVRGLLTMFEWPVPLRVLPEAEAPRARVTPLYVLDDREAWAESEWLGLWTVSAPGTRRGTPATLPAKDSARDDGAGPWVVAAAVERDRPHGGGTQRLVAVGANTWFTDRVTTQQASRVDGRVAAANPGNIELFEAAVSWLAGQDDRIGASATARAVPLIRPIDPSTLALVRWGVIGGLPVLTLAIGVLWRVWRG